MVLEEALSNDAVTERSAEIPQQDNVVVVVTVGDNEASVRRPGEGANRIILEVRQLLRLAAIERMAPLEGGVRCYLAPTLEERAALSEIDGDKETSRSELREAHRLYSEMGATAHAERLARELGL